MDIKNVAPCLIIMILFDLASCQQIFTLNTSLGYINGSSEDVVGTKLQIFLGVPYAKSPTNYLRLAPSELLESWPYPDKIHESSQFVLTVTPSSSINSSDANETDDTVPERPVDIWDGTRYRDACLQKNAELTNSGGQRITFSEDCLYLNIFAPVSQENENTSYPVLVLLHGGGWQAGSGQVFEGRQLAKQGLVVITLDFRIGFLSYVKQDNNDNNNLGLQDQRAALAWIQSYIKEFGGDPDDVTVVGAGSGASSLMYLLLGESEGLFHKAIVMSDSIGIVEEPYSPSDAESILSVALGDTGCRDKGDLSGCIRQMNNTQMLTIIEKDDLQWKPFLDGNVLPDDVMAQWKRASFRNIPVIFGASVSSNNIDISNLTRNEVKQELVNILREEYEEAAETVAVVTMREYAPQETLIQLQNVVKEVRDVQDRKTARNILTKYASSNVNKTYAYILSEGNVKQHDLLLALTKVRRSRRGTPSADTINLMNNVVVDFASSGDPASSLQPPSSDWEPVSGDQASHIVVSANPRPMNDMKPPREEFWEQYVPEVQESVDNAVSDARNAQPEPEPRPYFLATWILVAIIVLLIILMIALVIVVYKAKRDSYDMDREGTVKYVAK